MEDDSYAGKVQVKVYGDKKDASNYKEQYTPLASGSNITEVMFDASQLGTTFWGITLQTLTGAQTAKVKKVTLIKADGSEVALNVTAAWGCTVTQETVSSIPAIQNNKPDYNDGAIYNLQGQRISNPTKGIVIQNGKKFVVK